MYELLCADHPTVAHHNFWTKSPVGIRSTLFPRLCPYQLPTERPSYHPNPINLHKGHCTYRNSGCGSPFALVSCHGGQVNDFFHASFCAIFVSERDFPHIEVLRLSKRFWWSSNTRGTHHPRPHLFSSTRIRLDLQIDVDSEVLGNMCRYYLIRENPSSRFNNSAFRFYELHDSPAFTTHSIGRSGIREQ